MTLGFWHGFALGIIFSAIVAGYFYLEIKTRHDNRVLRLEAALNGKTAWGDTITLMRGKK